MPPQVPPQAFLGVLNTNPVAAKESLARIRAGWRDAYTAPLLELAGFVPVLSVQTEVLSQIERITGQRSGGLNAHYEWLWAREPGEHLDYAEFKAALYEQVDPRFREYFSKERKTIIRLDEIRWGGGVVTTTWGEWKKRHPGTTVLSLDTSHQRDYDEGAAYRDYFSNDRLMFGVPKLDARLPNKAEVLALRTSGKPAEDGLLGPGGASLKRLPAHRAFWFGWYAAYPATRLVK